MEKYNYVLRDPRSREDASIDFIDEEVVNGVQRFHSSFEQYQPTPLAELSNLAEMLGVKNIFVKDESYRFGLNAFKVLGGSYAIGKYIANELGIDISEMTAELMTSQKVKDELGEITFISATDGNHGRGVAWAAEQLGQNCVIYMPDGTSIQRRDAIRGHGAKCEILEGKNYDECVRYANQEAEENGWVMVQDTAWDGYEEIPTWIIQGYATMAKEAKEAIEEKGLKPTHIFAQAGVGSLATGIVGYFTSVYGQDEDKPKFIIVEPAKADPLYKTALADDGEIHSVSGKMDTIMAGLACGEPVTIGWPVLNSYVSAFMSIPEYAAARGMRILGNPLDGDDRVVSGESGASSFGAMADILQLDELEELKNELGFDSDSVILFFSTEGDTDFNHYRRVVWDGLHPSEEDYNYNK